MASSFISNLLNATTLVAGLAQTISNGVSYTTCFSTVTMEANHGDYYRRFKTGHPKWGKSSAILHK